MRKSGVNILKKHYIALNIIKIHCVYGKNFQRINKAYSFKMYDYSLNGIVKMEEEQR